MTSSKSASRRGDQYSRPHIIYALIDPRTRMARYVGRTTKKPDARLREHLRLADEHSGQPVYRWIGRLLQRGIQPTLKVLEEDVHHEREGKQCDSLLADGNLLLNVTGSSYRFCGKILVDVEQETKKLWIADVIHLSVTVTGQDPVSIQVTAAVAALRRVADLLEGRSAGTQYEMELSLAVMRRLFEYCEEGHKPRLRHDGGNGDWSWLPSE